MASNALVIGWNRAIAGREAMALELFNSANAWFGKQVAAGNIESFEPVMLSAHGGDLNGFTILRGDLGKLSALKQSDEFGDLITRCMYAIEGFGVIDAYINEGVIPWLARWQKVIASK